MALIGHGTTICTSTTRPSAPLQGQTIFETDTKLFQKWNGNVWSTLDIAGWEIMSNKVNYVWTGASTHSFTVPLGVTMIYGKCWGASGGPGRAGGWSYGGPGGAGGFAGGLIPVTGGETLTLITGQHGYPAAWGIGAGSRGIGGGAASSQNGSDNRYGGGGGGYSGIFRGSPSQGNALLIAGGGGGGGSTRAAYGAGQAGGAGGGWTGEMGYSLYDNKYGFGGRPGSQTSGGGQPSSDSANQDASGGALYGGWARVNSYGGGGGGGYFGGGGGGYSEANTMGGGGGGSGYAHSSVINPNLLTGTGVIPGNPDDRDIVNDGSNTGVHTAVGPVYGEVVYYGGIGLVVIRY